MADARQVVQVDEGSTKAYVRTADGRETQVAVQPDGSIVRSQRYTDEQGRAVEAHYEEGQTTVNVFNPDDGSRIITTTYPNGDEKVQTSVVHDDGARDIDTDYPDGTSTTEHIALLPNGGERHTVVDEGGRISTRVINKDEAGNAHEVSTDADGKTTTIDTLLGAAASPVRPRPIPMAPASSAPPTSTRTRTATWCTSSGPLTTP